MVFTKIFPIDGPWQGRLAISARPRGDDWLEEEMLAWSKAGIDLVVSLLEPAEAVDLELSLEKELSQAAGMEFYSFPIVDRSVPARGDALNVFLSNIDSKLTQGKNAVIHCRQGIGRAGLVAVTLLMERGLRPDEAIHRVSAARGIVIPETEEQRLWLYAFASALAGKA